MNNTEKKWYKILKDMLEKAGEYDNDIEVKEFQKWLVVVVLDWDDATFHNIFEEKDIRNKLSNCFNI